MEISKFVCFCLDAGTGSVLASIYTTALSVVFIGLGVEDMVLINKRVVGGQDIVTLTSVYGVLVALSLLYTIASAVLTIGATRKVKLYLIPWLVLTPLWSTTALAVLIILPLELSRAVRLTDSGARLAGALIILVLNTVSMVCVSVLLYVFWKTPRRELKSRGVVESLSLGFKDAGHRVRQSFRPKKKPKPEVAYFKRTQPDRVHVTIPHLSAPVVLQPASLEVVRSQKSLVKARSAAVLSRQEVDSGNDPRDVGDAMNMSLTTSEQLRTSDIPGLDNPGFLSEN